MMKPLLNISTSILVLPTPNTGQNMLFQHFLFKKAEKERKSKKFVANFSKKCVFELAPECLLRVLFQEKNLFSVVKTCS